MNCVKCSVPQAAPPSCTTAAEGPPRPRTAASSRTWLPQTEACPQRCRVSKLGYGAESRPQPEVGGGTGGLRRVRAPPWLPGMTRSPHFPGEGDGDATTVVPHHLLRGSSANLAANEEDSLLFILLALGLGANFAAPACGGELLWATPHPHDPDPALSAFPASTGPALCSMSNPRCHLVSSPVSLGTLPQVRGDPCQVSIRRMFPNSCKRIPGHSWQFPKSQLVPETLLTFSVLFTALEIYKDSSPS